MKDVLKRFWSRVVKQPRGCWLWTGRKGNKYGNFWFRGKAVDSHRVVWILTNGEIPDGMWVLHKCDNRRCVNPSHLFLGTRQDNIDDMIAKGRNAKGADLNHTSQKGSSNHNAKLTEEIVREVKRMLASGKKLREIEEATGVKKSNVWMIKKGFNWGHVTADEVGMDSATPQALAEFSKL